MRAPGRRLLDRQPPRGRARDLPATGAGRRLTARLGISKHGATRPGCHRLSARRARRAHRHRRLAPTGV